MKKIIVLGVLVFSGLFTNLQAQSEISSLPRLLGENVISTSDHEGNASFSPDGNVLYFTKFAPFDPGYAVIAYSKKQKNARWTQPELVEFTDLGNDGDPFVSPDGGKIIFASKRTLDGKAKNDFDLWAVEGVGEKWSQPKHLGAAVNSPALELSPAIAKNGTLYFWSNRPGGRGGADIYRARFENGDYKPAENLGEIINTAANESDLYVAPDESYLIFASNRPGGEGGDDLYISYRNDDSWTQPKNLGKNVNTKSVETAPHVSPDGRQLIFVSTRGFADETPAQPLTYEELQRRLKNIRNGRRNIYTVPFQARTNR